MFRNFLIVALIGGVILADQCPMDKMCTKCEDTKCKACYKSYLSSGECKEPTEKVDKCIAYTNATTCESCDFGYYYKSDEKKCEAIDIENCAAVNEHDSKVCTVCKNGVELEDGKCDAGNKKCPANCEMCTAGTCIICANGYALDANNACVKSEVDNCYIIDPADAKKCDTCKPDFYDTNEACMENFRIMGISSIVAFVVTLINL